MLGRLWLFDERVQHNGYENTCTLMQNGRKKILHPMKEISPLRQPKENSILEIKRVVKYPHQEAIRSY